MHATWAAVNNAMNKHLDPLHSIFLFTKFKGAALPDACMQTVMRVAFGAFHFGTFKKNKKNNACNACVLQEKRPLGGHIYLK